MGKIIKDKKNWFKIQFKKHPYFYSFLIGWPILFFIIDKFIEPIISKRFDYILGIIWFSFPLIIFFLWSYKKISEEKEQLGKQKTEPFSYNLDTSIIKSIKELKFASGQVIGAFIVGLLFILLVTYDSYLSTQTQQVAKTDKKEVKVVEQEQEEFKPKKKDLDKDPPIIEIAEAITVDSQSYTLKGKVKDKSKQIYLTIDGRPVDVKRGKFKVDRFNIDPEVVEEIKIVAIDKWNNKSEKIVKVTVKLEETQVVKAYEELKPNRIKVSKDDNKIAIIIGIEKYVNLTNLDAPFANRDAKAFKTYATRALGVKSSNIKLLVDDKAGRPQILEAFKLWLPRIIPKM